jgi:hypothetical protein
MEIKCGDDFRLIDEYTDEDRQEFTELHELACRSLPIPHLLQPLTRDQFLVFAG